MPSSSRVRLAPVLRPAVALVGLTIVFAACDQEADTPTVATDAGTDIPDASIPDASYDDAGHDDAGHDDAGDAQDAATDPPLRFGYCVHIGRQADPDAYLALAVAGGATTVRDDVTWAGVETSKGTFHWNDTDALVSRMAAHGLRPLLIIDTAPAWASGHTDSTWYPPIHAADYGDFARAVVVRYGPGGSFWSENPGVPVQALAGVELWNEENHRNFWRSGPDPAAYAAMLVDAFAKIKAVAPSIPVLVGGMAPVGGYDDGDCNGTPDDGIGANGSINPVNYLESLYAHGAGSSFDAVGHHPYNFWKDATATKMLAFHQCSAWSQMEETKPSLRSLMNDHGDGAKKIWATELGAPTCVDGATYPCISEAEQAAFATASQQAWTKFSWSGPIHWYDLRDDNGGTSTSDMEEHFGTVHSDGTPKPAHAALRDVVRNASPLISRTFLPF